MSKRNAWAAAALTWGLAAATLLFWLRPWWGTASSPSLTGSPAAESANLPATPPVDSARVAQALGAGPPDATPSGTPSDDIAQRFALVGVVRSARAAATGLQRASGAVDVALIAVDGQPARPYRVGAALDDRWRLQNLTAQGMGLAPLDAPPDAPASLMVPMPTLPTLSATPAPQ